MSDVPEIRVERQTGGWVWAAIVPSTDGDGAADSAPIPGSVSERGGRAWRRQKSFAKISNSICCGGIDKATAQPLLI
jgi:hypothetical protein